MIDQVPGKPEDWLSLWKGKVEIPFPKKLLEWMRDQDAVFIVVSVRLNKDNTILFRYQPIEASAESLRGLMESTVSEAEDQYNWSYPKIKV